MKNHYFLNNLLSYTTCVFLGFFNFTDSLEGRKGVRLLENNSIDYAYYFSLDNDNHIGAFDYFIARYYSLSHTLVTMIY